jgi:hypothetical protein
MPSYSALNTQIEAVKSEITASLAASTYTAQDLVYIAKTLETLGNLLGINDLVAASADAQASLNDTLEAILDGSAPANVGKLYVGAEAQSFETSAGIQDPAIIASIDTPDYAQIAFQNKGGGANSSTDFIAYANNGTDESGYIDIGITSSAFSDPDFTITGANDGYIFFEAPKVLTASINGKSLTNNVATLTTPTAHGFRVGMPVVITGVDGIFNGTYTISAIPTTTSFRYAKTNGDVTFLAVSPVGNAVAGTTGKGNLVFATSDNGTENSIIFAAGGLASDNTQMVIIPDQTVHVEIATQSTSTTTGALVVAGGMGVTGDVNIGGDVNITGTISFTGGGTTVETANISIVAPMVFTAQDNPSNLLDFAFVGEYNVGGADKWTAFSKDADTGVWSLVSNITTKPSTTINYEQAGLAYDKLKADQIILVSAPTANNNATTKLYVDTQRAQNELAQVMGIF